MSRYKTTLICLVLLLALCLPQPADAYPASNPILERTNTYQPHISPSVKSDNQGPRKKVKKKRRTILNRKTKMKSGKHCPSF